MCHLRVQWHQCWVRLIRRSWGQVPDGLIGVHFGASCDTCWQHPVTLWQVAPRPHLRRGSAAWLAGMR